MGMRLVVTGASGFIGRELVAWLAARGHGGCATSRTVPDSLPTGWHGRLRHAVLSDTPPPESCDAVVHLEVKHHLLRVRSADVADIQRVNVGGTREWLAWATAHELRRFLFVSSVKAVRNSTGTAGESAEAEQQDPYGRSKAEAEQAVREWAAADPGRSAIILRFAPVYGPGNQANLASFARQVIQGRPCLVGAGQARKSVLSRLNAVAAIDHALQKMQPGCEVFNVADPGAFSFADLAGFIAEACDAPTPRCVPRFAAACLARLGDAFEAVTGRGFVLDSRRLRTLTEDAIFPADKLMQTGFVPVEATRDGIAEMAKFVKAQDKLAK